MGYYERELMISVRRVSLKVPWTREGDFSPSVFEKYEAESKVQQAIEKLEDATQFLNEPHTFHRLLMSTNHLERLNQEDEVQHQNISSEKGMREFTHN